MSMSKFSLALITMLDLKSSNRCLIRRRTLNDFTLGRTRKFIPPFHFVVVAQLPNETSLFQARACFME